MAAHFVSPSEHILAHTNLTHRQGKEHPLCDAERQFREQDYSAKSKH